MLHTFHKARRLLFLAFFSILLGYMVFRTPGLKTVDFPDGSGYITVPRSLEFWRIEPGEGELLLKGHTLFRLNQLEVVRTHVTNPEDLLTYIATRHQQLFQVTDEYQGRLRGEIRRFGLVPFHSARGVYTDWVLGLPIRGQIVQHDVYVVHQGEYLRVGLRFPIVLERYVGMDPYVIAADLNQLSGGATR